MNLFSNLIKAATLSLLLAGSAFAADKVNINDADAAALDQVLVRSTSGPRRRRPSSITARPTARSRVPRNWRWSRASA